MPLTPVPLTVSPMTTTAPTTAPTARTAAASARLAHGGGGGVPTRADPVDILTGLAGSPLKALDPALSETLNDARAAMEKTLETVEKAVRDDGEMRKAAALEKVRMLRARLQTLTMTAANDPEGAAREAAQIARALASAVHGYVSAGGSATDIGGGAGAAPPVSGAAQPASADNRGAPGDDAAARAEAQAQADARAVDARDEALGFVREVRAMMQNLRDILDFAERWSDEDDRGTGRAVRDGLATLRGMTEDVGRLAHQPVILMV